MSRFTFTSDPLSYPRIILSAPAALPPATQPALLRASLQVLRAMTADHHEWFVKLQGWTLTDDVVMELSGLPAWAKVLSVAKCEWLPEPDNTAALLVAGVPRGCGAWVVEGASVALVREIVTLLAAEGGGAGRERSKIRLCVGYEEWMSDVQLWAHGLGPEGWVKVEESLYEHEMLDPDTYLYL